jgi:hypothetical protein
MTADFLHLFHLLFFSPLQHCFTRLELIGIVDRLPAVCTAAPDRLCLFACARYAWIMMDCHCICSRLNSNSYIQIDFTCDAYSYLYPLD